MSKPLSEVYSLLLDSLTFIKSFDFLDCFFFYVAKLHGFRSLSCFDEQFYVTDLFWIEPLGGLFGYCLNFWPLHKGLHAGPQFISLDANSALSLNGVSLVLVIEP